MSLAPPTPAPPSPHRVTARALALGARLDAAGLERPDTISVNPLAFSVGTSGFVALYRFGVAVLVGLTPVEEDAFVRQSARGCRASANGSTTSRPSSR